VSAAGGGLAAVLAVDGGNSKTDVALVGPDGSIVGKARGGGSNYQNVGTEQATAVLRALVSDVAIAAGMPPGGPVAEHTSACLAGADLPEEEADLGALVQAQGWSATSSVVNDTYAVLRAGLDDVGAPGTGQHWGVGVVCGAGINCVGVAPDGRTTRFPALGRISGDWGGGGEIAAEALWWAVRAEDGRGPQTALRTAVPAHFGVRRVEDVVGGIHFGKISYAELHGLAPVLFEVANRGDQVATDVLRRQAEEICLMVTAAARRLGLGGDGGSPVPVVLGGSLMAAKDPILTGAIVERLAARLPGADIRIVDVPPVVGAALLGLDHVGAQASAAARLREYARATW
jgi:N-acetylglucosamine kinase-like BadF-type ATPase